MANRYSFYAASEASSGAEHIPSFPSNDEWIEIESLTVSIRGADTTSDVTIKIQDDTTVRWHASLRSGKVFLGYFTNIGLFKISSGIFKIVTSSGGASVIVDTSCVYLTKKNTEL